MSGSITYKTITVPFLVGSTPSGFISDQPIVVAEELQVNGVDGTRWREINRQYPDFELVTVSQSASVAAANALKRSIESLAHKKVTLSIVISALNYTMKNVHIQGVSAVVAPGPLYGLGVSSAAAHVISRWLLRGTDFNI